MSRQKHPLDDLYAAEIKRVREGDVAAAQRMMLHCAKALRELVSGGGNNLASQHAVYLAQVLKRLSGSEATARLFCLGMPKHRPRSTADSPIHLYRAQRVLAKYKRGGTLDEAIKAVAESKNKSIGAIRASWKKKGDLAESELLFRTPKAQRSKVRLPGASAMPWRNRRGDLISGDLLPPWC